MNAAQARSLILTFPHAVETMQWGDNLVFWVGDKAIGGKMFALVALDADGRTGDPVISFAAGPEPFEQLLESDGLVPAPYFARIHWIAATRWSALTATEWQSHLRYAYDLTYGKLPSRVQAALALPAGERRRLIAERRQALEAKATAKASPKALPTKAGKARG